MIPVFNHCPDRGHPPERVKAPWGSSADGYWWCRFCKLMLH